MIPPHMPGSAGVAARIASNRLFLQCLASLDLLVGRGLERLVRGRPNLFYACVLKSERPGSIPVGKAHADYKAMLEDKYEDKENQDPMKAIAADIDEGDGCVVARKPRKPCKRQSDHAQNPKAKAKKRRPVLLEDSEDSSSSSTSSSSNGRDRSAIREEFHVVNGFHICHEEHLTPGVRGYYSRYIIKCNSVRHWCRDKGHCRKKRNAGTSQTSLGPKEPLAFLCVWAFHWGEFLSRHAHIRHSPAQAEVLEYMREHDMF